MMSQFGTPGKNPPWARNTGTTLGQSGQLSSPLIMQATLGGPGVTQAQAVGGNQVTLQQQQAVAPQTAFNAAGLTALSLAQVGLDQTRDNLFLVQPGVALPTSLATTPVVGTAPGLALQATLTTTPVATVSYPAPRVLQHTTQFQPQQLPAPPLTPKQRVITGTVTKLQDSFGFVDDDVFFQISCVKGAMPKVGDRVLVEASYNPNMPFKWNALRIQLLPNQSPGLCSPFPQGQMQVQSHQQNSLARPGMMPPNSIPPIMNNSNMNPQLTMTISQQQGGLMPPTMSMSHMPQPTPNYNQVPPPDVFVGSQYAGQQPVNRLPTLMGTRRHSPPPVIRRERERDVRRHQAIDGGGIVGGNDRRERERHREGRDHERERERERAPAPSKRSRSPRPRSRSLPRRQRTRVAPRYVVQIPKISLDLKEANVMELRKRYSNMYVPSDFFISSFVWMDAFPLSRPFTLERPGTFHIMNKEVDPLKDSGEAATEPQDIDHTFTAKVMLLSAPPLDELYHKSCALAEDPSEVKENFVHPTRLISFLVGLKNKNETMAIGGAWSPSLDGLNPEKDPMVLVKTAIRTCRALTGIDLSSCTKWYRFAEVYYHRAESTHKGRVVPARVETVVLFLPDVWSCTPTRQEWQSMAGAYKKQLQRKLHEEAPDAAENQATDDSQKDLVKKDPSHHSDLDPKSMKITDLRHELEVRNLSCKGLKSQLIARLNKALKIEHEKEEEDADGKPEDQEEEEEEKMDVEEKEDKKKEEEERKKDEKERAVRERRYTLPETPAIVVHPSRVAKGGKFDCTVMSLSVLLDYRQEDNKEYSFEVSLFAELFNEMLMRDFGFRIYRALVEVPEKKEVEDKDNEKKKEKDKKEENKKDDKDEGDSKKEFCNSKDTKKRKEDDDKEVEQEFDEEEEDDDMEDEDDDERKDRKRDDKKQDKDKKTDKNKLFTADPSLLLASVYFDQNHCGYLLERDLEEILYTLGLNLSRAQVRKLLQNAVVKENFLYRKLTDKPKIKETSDNEIASDSSEKIATSVEELSAGNRTLLGTVKYSTNGGPREGATNSSPPDVTNAGAVIYDGALLYIAKLLQQLQRSELARTTVEDKLMVTQEELAETKEIVTSTEQSNQKLSSELRNFKTKLKLTEDDLKTAREKVENYQDVIVNCHHLLQPTIQEVSLGINDLQEDKAENATGFDYDSDQPANEPMTNSGNDSGEATIAIKLECDDSVV